MNSDDLKRIEEKYTNMPCSACMLTIDENGKVHHESDCMEQIVVKLARVLDEVHEELSSEYADLDVHDRISLAEGVAATLREVAGEQP